MLYTTFSSHPFADNQMFALQTRVPAPLAGSTASYTSWGPDIDLTFKPTIAAPGSVIVSNCTFCPSVNRSFAYRNEEVNSTAWCH